MPTLQYKLILGAVVIASILVLNNYYFNSSFVDGQLIGVSARANDSGKIIFQFERCKTKNDFPGISEISVEEQPEHESSSPRIMCALNIIDVKRANDGHINQWAYSENINGFSLNRCEQLKPGHTYTIYMKAKNSQIGGMRFIIDNNGQLLELNHTACT